MQNVYQKNYCVVAFSLIVSMILSDSINLPYLANKVTGT